LAPLLIAPLFGQGVSAWAPELKDAGRRLTTLAPLDCATLGAELLESTLMLLTEHESRRGAATTLLLNNIDHMPAEVQARLMRLIDSGSLGARSSAWPGSQVVSASA